MRIPRSLILLPGFSAHKMWNSHNDEWNLKTAEQKLKYLEFLNADLESEKYETGAELNALTLMSNHAHEIFRIMCQSLFSDHMRRHHGRYGAWFNKVQKRRGKVARDRPKTCQIGDDYYAMIATMYIHANPVRAKMVKDANDYAWSTHRLYAFGKKAPWMRNVKLPAWYLRLGKTLKQCQKKYRSLFAKYLEKEGLKKAAFLYSHCFGHPVYMVAQKTVVAEWRQANRPP